MSNFKGYYFILEYKCRGDNMKITGKYGTAIVYASVVDETTKKQIER